MVRKNIKTPVDPIVREYALAWLKAAALGGSVIAILADQDDDSDEHDEDDYSDRTIDSFYACSSGTESMMMYDSEQDEVVVARNCREEDIGDGWTTDDDGKLDLTDGEFEQLVEQFNDTGAITASSLLSQDR